jgi:hypothetical protein
MLSITLVFPKEAVIIFQIVNVNKSLLSAEDVLIFLGVQMAYVNS